jgi:hypothetical protein
MTIALEDVHPLSELPDGAFHEHKHVGETRALLARLNADIDVATWADGQVLDGPTPSEIARVMTDDRGLRWLRSDHGPDQCWSLRRSGLSSSTSVDQPRFQAIAGGQEVP